MTHSPLRRAAWLKHGSRPHIIGPTAFNALFETIYGSIEREPTVELAAVADQIMFNLEAHSYPTPPAIGKREFNTRRG